MNIAKKLIFIETQTKPQDDNVFLQTGTLSTSRSLIHLLVTRVLLCLLCIITFSADADISAGYPPEVAALLQKYQNALDADGSTIPSIFAYRSDSTGRTLSNFESGLIMAFSATISGLKQRIVEVLLTQIDPGVIDAHTAYDLGLINHTTKKPFFSIKSKTTMVRA